MRVLIAPGVAESVAKSFALDESTNATLAVAATWWRKSTEGVNLEAADEVVDRMAENPRLAKRFRHMSIKTAPVLLRILDRSSPHQVPLRWSSCARPVRRAQVRRHRARSRSPGRSTDDPDHHHRVGRRPRRGLLGGRS